MAVHLLTAVSIKTVTANKVFIQMFATLGINILGNEKPARSANRLAFRRTQTGNKSSSAFDREMVHQVMAEHTV